MTPSPNDLVLSRNLAERNAIISTLDGVKAIAEFSPDGVLLYANQRYLSIFGYAPDEVTGLHHSVFCDAAYVASPGYATLWARLQSGMAYTDLCERRKRDGSVCWLEATYAPIIDARGKVARIFKMAGDVTARVDREHHAQEQTRMLSLVADATDSAVLIADGDWRIVYVNRGFIGMFGISAAEAKSQVPPELLAPHLPPSEIAGLLAELKAGRSIRREELLRGATGERYWCSISTNPVLDDAGRLINAVSVLTDITQSKMHQVLQHRVLEAIASERSLAEVGEMICVEVDRILPDAATCIVEIEASGRLKPLSAPQLPRAYLAHLSGHVVSPEMVSSREGSRIGSGGAFIDITADPRWSLFRDGLMAVGYLAFWAVPIASAEGQIVGAVVFHYREVRTPDDFHRKLMKACVNLCALALERDRAKARIRKLAFYDPLTNLPNRSLLNVRAEQVFASASRDGAPAAVLFIDLDRFKHVNDSLGHPAGDAFLQLVADRLMQDRRAADIVSRISGDEFVVVLPGCDARRTAEAVERLQSALRSQVQVANVWLNPSASIGIAMFPADGNNIEMLLHRADMAMYQAKTTARGNFAFFSSELNASAQERLALESDLRIALQEGALHLNYQPQLELGTRRLHGVEVLARWHHPARGDVPPTRFIPLAEDCNLVGPLTAWVLETACAQFSAWRRRGFRIPSLSVNVSPLTLHDAGLPDLVRETLHRHGLTPSDLIIEITEGVMLEQHEATMGTIRRLDAMGIRLSMDDFGTGYSSLSYLHSLPITELKLDRSFVSDLGERDSALPLSRAIIQIGVSLGLTVVAEGVETETQRRLLSEQGCHVVQGYLFAKPLAPAALETWMAEQADGSASAWSPLAPARVDVES